MPWQTLKEGFMHSPIDMPLFSRRRVVPGRIMNSAQRGPRLRLVKPSKHYRKGHSSPLDSFLKAQYSLAAKGELFQNRSHNRLTSAIKELQRLPRNIEPEEEQPLAGAREWRFLREKPKAKPLSRRQRGRDPVLIVGNQQIRRRELAEIERMIIEYGLEVTLMRIALQYPFLADMMKNPATFEKFVKSKFVHPKWKERLLSVNRYASKELRAVALMLFLRKAYVNPPQIRAALHHQMQRAA